MSRLRYQPALDGVRAVAVVLVLLFHLGMPWMRAGYLGVSLFFTLSGYLITSLLLGEHSETGGVSFRTFYSRRARRLLPASLLVLAVVVLASRLGEFANVPGLRDDLLGALLQVHNWVQIAGSSSYGDLFSGAAAFVSPVEHFWSLAIEEQFYLLWPVALVLMCRRPPGPKRAVLVMTAGSFVLAPAIGLWFGPDVAYWSTPSRLPELLVGACVAVLLHERPAVPAGARHAAGPLLLAVVVCSVVVPSGSGPAFTGWLWPFALASGLLLVALQPDGPVRRLLSVRPLVAVGKVSYGLYLFHWPVFTLLRQHGWRLDEAGPAALALAITAAVTTVSYTLLERPVRAAAWAPRRTAVSAAVAGVAVLAAVLVVPVQRGFLEADTGTLDAASIDTGAPAETLARATTTTSTSP
ncbi:MAG: acyltransferase, partial [Acidobacteria bacterium]|nr:acyltransferase [Acidobacteriota bacterium]